MNTGKRAVAAIGGNPLGSLTEAEVVGSRQDMKRTRANERYYDCIDTDCRGKMIQVGLEPIGKKQAVYECTKCKRKADEASLLLAYRKLKMWD